MMIIKIIVQRIELKMYVRNIQIGNTCERDARHILPEFLKTYGR